MCAPPRSLLNQSRQYDLSGTELKKLGERAEENPRQTLFSHFGYEHRFCISDTTRFWDCGGIPSVPLDYSVLLWPTSPVDCPGDMGSMRQMQKKKGVHVAKTVLKVSVALQD
jgi:hypothetical protein